LIFYTKYVNNFLTNLYKKGEHKKMAKLKTGRHTSALKELRKSLKRKEHNLKLKNKIKQLKKQLDKLIQEKKLDEAKQTLNLFYKAVDKAAKVNYIHKNKAARLKSAAAKQLVNFLSTTTQSL